MTLIPPFDKGEISIRYTTPNGERIVRFNCNGWPYRDDDFCAYCGSEMGVEEVCPSCGLRSG